MLPRWRKITATRRQPRRPRSATRSRERRQNRRAPAPSTIDASDAYRVTQERRRATRRCRRTPASGASARNAPPAVATIFPPFWKREEHRPRVADHRCGSREDTDQRPAGPEPERGRGEALRDVEQRDRHARASGRRPGRRCSRRRCRCPSCGCPRARGADPVAERQRAEEYPPRTASSSSFAKPSR